MPSPFTRRFVVEVAVTEVTPAAGDSESRISQEPTISGKKEAREDSMPPVEHGHTEKPTQRAETAKKPEEVMRWLLEPARVKPLAEIKPLDVPRGLDPEDIATDVSWK